MVEAANSQTELQKLLDEHHEWLLLDQSGKGFPFQKTEIEITFERNKLLFAFLDDKGFQTWRVADFKTKGAEILLKLTRNFEKEREKVRLVPRVLAKELSESVELARLEKANQIAAIVKEISPKTKLVRVELNKENGRFAQIIFENPNGKQTAVLADVTENLTPEFLLSTACLWLARLQSRKKKRVETVWIAGEKKQARKLQQLHALLKESWKVRILIKEISGADLARQKAKRKRQKLGGGDEKKPGDHGLNRHGGETADFAD